MASYTDAISTFNPYVSQLPIIEEMSKVGMERQAKYDQGIQKIQGHIDNVAGMDIYKDVDKAVLQSKLNQLGSDLRKVAASDFSNFQLVNSVGGMATQIIKDPIIQNAVSSTATYKKQAAEMEKAIKEGKSSQANIYDFTEKAGKWMNSTKPGEKFSDRYTQYTDVNKKWLDVLKVLHPNLKEGDIPYEIDPTTGKPDYNKISAAMQRVSKENVSAAQIENALRSSLSPDDLNQLSINAKYDFRGATPESLIKYSTKNYESAVTATDKYIAHLEGVARLNASNPTMRDKALDTIDEQKQRRLTLKTNYDESVKLANENPDAAKFLLYKNGAISEFANAFSWESEKMQVIDNPVLNSAHWEKTYALDKSKFNLSVKAENFSEWKGREEVQLGKDNLSLKMQELAIKTRGNVDGMVTYGGQSTLIKDPISAMKNDAITSESFANNKLTELAKGIGTSIAGAESAIKEYQNGNTKAIPVNWRGTVDDINASRLQAFNLNSTIDKAEKEALTDPTSIATQAAINKQLQTKPGLTVLVDGQPTTYTQKEVFDFLSKAKYSGSGIGSRDFDPRNLSKKELGLYRAAGYSPITEQGLSTPAESSKITSLFTKYNDVLVIGKQFRNELDTKIANNLLDKAGKYIPAQYNINVSNKDGATSRDMMENIAMNTLMGFGEALGGIKGGAKDLSTSQVTTARGWLAGKDKDDIQYKKLVQGGETFLVMVKGSEEIVIPTTSQIAEQLPKNRNEVSAKEVEIRELQQMGNGNTNITSDPTKSHFQKPTFENLKSLYATADLQWDQKNKGLNYININLKLPSGWKNIQLDDYPMDASKASERINRLTDNELKEIFLKDNRVSESVKDEIRNLK